MKRTLITPDELESLTLIGSLSTKEVGSAMKEISKEVIMSLVITSEEEFDFNLILQNDDTQEWASICFPISNDRYFKALTFDSLPCLLWERNKCFYLFKILLDKGNTKNYPTFSAILKTMVLSNEYQIPLANASKEQSLNSYLTQYDLIENINDFIDDNYKHYRIPKQNIAELTQQMEYTSLNQKKTCGFLALYPQAKCFFKSSEGMLFKYDKLTDQLSQVGDKCIFAIYKTEEFKYYLAVHELLNSDEALAAEPTLISSSASITVDSAENMIKWLGTRNKAVVAFGFLFSLAKDIELATIVLSKSRYEASAQSTFEKLEKEDQSWLMNENKATPEESSESSDDVDMDFDNKYGETQTQKENKFTEQAYLYDRTFAFKKDNTVEVYKSNENDIEHLMNLPAVATYDNKSISVSNAHMYKGDASMLLLDSKSPNSLFEYDITKGQIVSEWSTGNINGIISICPENKLDQMTNNQVVVGINSNTLFSMDGRLNKSNKVNDSKAYKTKVDMSCVSSTNFGGIVTGSNKGEIRLYKAIGKNAKTLLQCYNDPIRSIDVTKDGKFIVATCDYYLLIFNTTIKDSNGFLTPMGKNKPGLRTLQLNPIDKSKYGLEKAKYTPARFNIGKDRETNITTSLGEFIIVWSLDKIKKGIINDYKIKRVNQVVINNQFKFDKNQVVVTMPNVLRIQNQKKLE